MISSPTELSSCFIWLDGADVSTMGELSSTGVGDVVNGDLVGLWQNKVSPFERDFSATGTVRPIYKAALSGVNLTVSPTTYLTSTFSKTYTAQSVFVAVSRGTDATGNNRLYTQVHAPVNSDGYGAGTYVPLIYSGVTQIGGWVNTVDASRVTIRNPNTVDVISAIHNGSSIRNYCNGVGGSTFNNTLSCVTSMTRIGQMAPTVAGPAGAAGLGANIHEVIVYDRALTDVERADVEYYLTRKWSFLNSIPRQVYGIKNGLWSSTDTWSVSAEPSPWNYPLSDDNAYTNTFTITADSSTRVSTLQNAALSPNIASGGSFILANGVSLSATLRESSAPCLVTFNPSTTATIVGNLFPLTTTSPLVSCRNNSSLTIVGNSNSTNGGWNIINSSGCNLTIFGNVFNSSNSTGQFSSPNILNSGNCTIFGQVSGFASSDNGVIRNAGTLNIFGNVSSGATWFRGATIAAGYGGTTNIVGNLFFTVSPSDNQGGLLGGSYGQTITCNVTGNLGSYSVGMYNGGYIVSVVGNLIPDYSMGCIPGTYAMNGPFTLTVRNGILGTNSSGGYAAGNCSSLTLISGTAISTNNVSPVGFTSTGVATLCGSNIINAPNGRQAIFSPKILMFPGTSPTYTRHAVNGYDSYVDYWTSDATFTYPASSDVALGTTYSNGSLTGSMVLPSPSSVALGSPVGSTTGTAVLTINDIFNAPLSSLTTPNSIGSRLKNIATTQALTAIVDGFTY